MIQIIYSLPKVSKKFIKENTRVLSTWSILVRYQDWVKWPIGFLISPVFFWAVKGAIQEDMVTRHLDMFVEHHRELGQNLGGGWPLRTKGRNDDKKISQ